MDVVAEYRRLKGFLSGWLDSRERERAELLIGMLTACAKRKEPLRSGDFSGWRRGVVRDFCSVGALAIFSVPGGRGADFAANHGIGEWGERLFEMSVQASSDFNAFRFGPSDGILPGNGDYATRRRLYREVEVIEGKRPDYLLFPSAAVKQPLDFSGRRLTPEEMAFVRAHAVAGVEVKHSARHHAAYKAATGRLLSFALKEEEYEGMKRWQDRSGTPIILFQMFLDEVWVVSFDRFNTIKGVPRTEPITGKRTWFAPLEGCARISSIKGGPGYHSIPVDPEGRVGRPDVWPDDAWLEGFDPWSLAQAVGWSASRAA
jgi:hypothetical protein